MALSTNIPTAKLIPASEIVFRLLPIAARIIKVAMILIGIASPTTAVALIERKKSNKTPIARIAPMSMFC